MHVPNGFVPIFRRSPAIDLIGPMYSKGMGRDMQLGLMVEAKHCNVRGVMHGGFLATLADSALGYALAFSSDPPIPLVTINLSIDYAGAANVGDWLETTVETLKIGSRLAFANCYISAAGERIARASGSFLVAAGSPPSERK